MQNERAILCGNVTDGSLPFDSTEPVRLRLWGPHQNVRLSFDDIRHYMVSDIPSRFNDLLEIATYVYCADQAVTRGGDGVDNLGENWRRRFYFRIPVRNPDFWSGKRACELLRNTLGFLSEDEYDFEFTKLTNGPTIQQYLKFAEDDTPLGQPEDVVLFSGGLDSLGGAVQEAVIDKRKVALVTHKSTDKLSRRHRHLRELLADHCPEAPPIHIPVSINKAKELGREYTQRTRSFLYAALAATIARMLELSRIRFYENGVVSFNLPPSAQVIGARATRTTHPQVINGFTRLLSAVAGRRFWVETPFLWLTKTDVLKVIAGAGCSELIKHTTSCTHTWEITNLQPHCGDCSQCIDRRFAVLAAGLEAHDPREAYKVDLLVDERAEGAARTMLAAYAETASQVAKMSPVEFFARYGEASRVLRHVDGSADTTGLRLYELHKRHAQQVTDVIKKAIGRHASDILQRTLPPTCLLRLVCDASGSIPGGAAPSTPPAVSLPPNYIWQKGQCWAIRFGGGEERIYTPDTGFYYLQILLDSAGTSFSASELDCAVSRKTKDELRTSVSAGEDPTGDGVTVLGQSDSGAVLDDEAIRSYLLRLKEINEDLDRAKANNDLAKVDELEREKEWITTELTNAQGLGGRIRVLGDERNKVRNRVCNAIRRALKKISQYDKRLSDHLTRPVLNLGHAVSYVPRDGLTWSTIPTQTT